MFVLQVVLKGVEVVGILFGHVVKELEGKHMRSYGLAQQADTRSEFIVGAGLGKGCCCVGVFRVGGVVKVVEDLCQGESVGVVTGEKGLVAEIGEYLGLGWIQDNAKWFSQGCKFGEEEKDVLIGKINSCIIKIRDCAG